MHASAFWCRRAAQIPSGTRTSRLPRCIARHSGPDLLGEGACIDPKGRRAPGTWPTRTTGLMPCRRRWNRPSRLGWRCRPGPGLRAGGPLRRPAQGTRLSARPSRARARPGSRVGAAWLTASLPTTSPVSWWTLSLTCPIAAVRDPLSCASATPRAALTTPLRLVNLHMHRAVDVAPLALRPVATLEVFDEIGPTPVQPRILGRKQGLVERPHIRTIRIEGRVVGESRHICVNARITDPLRIRPVHVAFWYRNSAAEASGGARARTACGSQDATSVRYHYRFARRAIATADDRSLSPLPQSSSGIIGAPATPPNATEALERCWRDSASHRHGCASVL